MRYMNSIIAAIVFVSLTACASYGTKVDQNQLSQFVKGKTTYAEVVQKLGKPTQVMNNSDGTRIVHYTHGTSQANAASYIPIVGAFAGGYTSETTTVMFRFDQNSVLVDYSTSESGFDTGYGVLGGVMGKN